MMTETAAHADRHEAQHEAPIGAVTALRPDLAATLESEQIVAARANLARLHADLADAQIASRAAITQHEAAQRAWDRAEQAGAPHAREDAERLTRLWRDASDTQAAITALEGQIADAMAILARDAEVEVRQRRITLAETLWPPMVQRLIPLARALYAALEEQATVREHLIEAGAWPHVNVDALLFHDHVYDDPSPTIARWLAEVRRNGYTM